MKPEDIDKPLKCAVCGRFVSPYGGDGSTHRLVTPDSAYTCEEWETLCKEHSKREKEAQTP